MRRFALVAVFFASSVLFAQQPLNNDAVAKMTKAGLSDELIITAVNSQPGSYDTTSNGLIGLKTSGVSDKVVSAILQKNAAAIPAPNTSSAPPQEKPAGIPQPSPQEPAPAPGKPRVFLSAASKGNNQNSARDQAMEMSHDLEKNCPSVRITINSQAADYTVLLNHIEVGLLVRDNQFQIANKDGDLITKTKEGGSIKGGAKRACELILADWAKK